MVLDSKDTYQKMLQKGFIKAPSKSPDHKWIEFWYDGKLTRAKTKFSHNGQDINDFLISQISKQICLTKGEFLKFIQCTISVDAYANILKERKFL